MRNLLPQVRAFGTYCLGSGWARAQLVRAATRPEMVCSLASTSTVRPLARAVSAVIGPMQATAGGTASGPSSSRKRSTVDDDVHSSDEHTSELQSLMRTS